MAGILLAAALLAGPFAAPKAAAPEVTTSAAKTEAERQGDFALETRWAETERVSAVAERLLAANAALCPQTRSRLGLRVATAGDLKPPWREAAVRRWTLSDTVKVVGLTEGGAARTAGLEIGDELLSLDGQPIAGGKKATEAWGKQLLAALDKAPESVTLTVRRSGETRDLIVKPVRACAYDVTLDDNSKELNAYADGKSIVLTRPILHLAASDNELALVMAHELAHNARNHIGAQRHNAAVGMVGGAALDILIAATTGVNTQGAFTKAGGQIGQGAYSPEFEAEADYVGLYFMTRAGFATDGVENFWRKMAAEEPRAIIVRSSHPPTAERYLAIAAARDEIAKKGGDLAALLPNEKGKTDAGVGAPAAAPAVAAAAAPTV